MPQPLRPLLAAVSSTVVGKPIHPPLPHQPASEPSTKPFVTLSREAGAGGRTLMTALADRLNTIDKAQTPWVGYDHQLIEKVTEEHGMPARHLDMIESDEPRWLVEIFETLGQNLDHEPTPPQIYRKVVHTIRQLARDGRCVIVGRGAALATADLAGGVHVRLVAPLHQRIANLAEQHQMSQAHAEAEVQRLDKARDRFYKRFWHIDPIGPEHFHLTLNTARLTEPQCLDTILSLLPKQQIL